eukprot:Colp12_sorted_trinity150504_noHs@8783
MFFLRVSRIVPSTFSKTILHHNTAKASFKHTVLNTGAPLFAKMASHDSQELNSFLETCKAKVKTGSPVHIVMGNEASDLDSMVCSIVHSLFLQRINGNNAVVYAPYINIPRAEFPLRTEAAYLFKKLDIKIDHLIFENEVDLKILKEQGSLEITLVDHNALATKQKFLEPCVKAIIDHHVDEHKYSSAQRNIAMIGSCATLVSEMIFEAPFGPTLVSGPVGDLLLSTILLDTVNLDPTKGRGTPRDESAAARLLEFCPWIDRNTEFKAISDAKFDQSGLSVDELLRKDYKEEEAKTHKYGIASIGVSIHDLLAKYGPDALLEMVTTARRERALHSLMIMAAFTGASNSFSRQLLITADDEASLDNIAAFLEAQ